MKKVKKNNKLKEKRRDTTNAANKEWINRRKAFRHKRRNSEPMCMSSINLHSTLEELDDDDEGINVK